MSKNWKKEVARDCVALGSIPFYFIVMVRAVIGQYAIFVYQLVIALVVLVILSFIIKKSDMYIARCFILCIFTSLFYRHTLYAAFALLLWIFLVISSHYLGTKKNVIIKGIVLGVISSGVAYYLAELVA